MDFEEIGDNISVSDTGEEEPAQTPLYILQTFCSRPKLSLIFQV